MKKIEIEMTCKNKRPKQKQKKNIFRKIYKEDKFIERETIKRKRRRRIKRKKMGKKVERKREREREREREED